MRNNETDNNTLQAAYNNVVLENKNLKKEIDNYQNIITTIADCSLFINNKKEIIESLSELFSYMVKDTTEIALCYYTYNKNDKQFNNIYTSSTFSGNFTIPSNILINQSLIGNVNYKNQDDITSEICESFETKINIFPFLTINNDGKHSNLEGFFVVLTTAEARLSEALFHYIGNIISRFIISTKEHTEIQKVKDITKLYLDGKLLDSFLHSYSGNIRDIKPDKKPIIILSTDIEGYTSFSERINPDELLHILNLYTSKLIEIVKKHNGVVDKIMGDGILVLFGVTGDDEAQMIKNAIECAEDIYRNSIDFEQSEYKLATIGNFFKKNNYSFKVRIGIEMDETIIGNIGGCDRYDYTVIGKAVNKAFKIQYENKKYRTSILLGENFKKKCPAKYVDRIRQITKNAPIEGLQGKGTNLYELVNFPSFNSNNDFYNDYSTAFDMLHTNADPHVDPESILRILLRHGDIRKKDVPAQYIIKECFKRMEMKMSEHNET